MNKLEEARKSINEIDAEIAKLFEKRMEASKLVAEYKKENNENVAWIVKELGFHQVSVKDKLPEVFLPYVNEDGSLQLYRGELPCDGFFIAVLIKD